MVRTNLFSNLQRAADTPSTSNSTSASPAQKAVPVKHCMNSSTPALLADIPKRTPASVSLQTADMDAPLLLVQNPAMPRVFEKLPRELRHDIGTRLDSADLLSFSQVDKITQQAVLAEVVSLHLSDRARKVSSPQDVSNVMAGINELKIPALQIAPLQNLGGLHSLDPATRKAAFNTVHAFISRSGSNFCREKLLPTLSHSFCGLETPVERSQALGTLVKQVRLLPINQQLGMMQHIRYGIAVPSTPERVALQERVYSEKLRILEATTARKLPPRQTLDDSWA